MSCHAAFPGHAGRVWPLAPLALRSLALVEGAQ